MNQPEKKLRLFVSSFIVGFVAAASPLAFADGLIVVHDHDIPILFDPPQYRFAPLEIRFHRVSTRITDQIAETSVDQSFYNPSPRQLEGTYIFPIPKGAQIDRFSMDIDGKLVDAELLDAAKARQVYEDIVRRSKDPGLLEYAGQGLLRARVFPIEPHREKRIQIRYTQLLENDAGMIEFLYPLNTEKFSSAPIQSVAIKVELECAKGIKSVYSPSHPVDIRRDGNRATIGYEATGVRPDTDFQLLFAPDATSDIGINLLSYNDGIDAAGGYFVLLASPSDQVSTSKIVEKDVVFVADTSGSMAAGDKIGQAKRALEFCLRNLNTGDRFDVVRFSTDAQPLFQALTPVNSDSIAKASQFVLDFKPVGGTAIEAALLKAMEIGANRSDRDRPLYIVFLTDGLPTVGTRDDKQICSSVLKASGGRSVRVFCFGIGSDVNTHLLDAIANETRAASQYVLPNEDIEVKVSNFYAKISQPVLANVKLRVGGGIRFDKTYPTELPDLFRGEQLILFGRYTGSGDAHVTLEGTVNGEPRSFTYDARFPQRTTDRAFIPRMWATRRVGYLLDQIRLNGETSELRDEVTSLARQFGIVTPYTAYLILEDEARRNVPASAQTLRTLGYTGDGAARREMARMSQELMEKKSGGEAVGDAQAIDSLRNAQTAAAPSQANVLAIRARVDGDGLVDREALAARASIQSQQTRIVAGRAFYQNGSQWIDSEVQRRQGGKVVQVKFDSEHYYALLNKHADAPKWLSVARNLQLVIDDTIYEIVE